mmetsp:Transcript_94543/g.305258  ORF Transcript_94543/g.305258 Transcript_94543/m.305258 type:complete len:216 (-) Transcript_94543:922-1569(-)
MDACAKWRGHGRHAPDHQGLSGSDHCSPTGLWPGPPKAIHEHHGRAGADDEDPGREDGPQHRQCQAVPGIESAAREAEEYRLGGTQPQEGLQPLLCDQDSFHGLVENTEENRGHDAGRCSSNLGDHQGVTCEPAEAVLQQGRCQASARHCSHRCDGQECPGNVPVVFLLCVVLHESSSGPIQRHAESEAAEQPDRCADLVRCPWRGAQPRCKGPH